MVRSRIARNEDSTAARTTHLKRWLHVRVHVAEGNKGDKLKQETSKCHQVWRKPSGEDILLAELR